MSETNHINLDYRPESYWPESLTPDQLISRIQGKVRQDIARSKFKTEGFTGLTAFIAREELDENDKVMWGRIHPLFMGGEYLPSLEQIEVEIARISLKSVTGDQISIRARKTDGTIIYSVVGEYGEDMQYQQPFDESNEPLKLAELVKLIDGSAIPGDIYPGGLVTSSWWACYELNIDVDEALNFVSLTSAFYPELDAYYESVAKIWREDRYRENFEVYSYIGTEIADPGYNNDRPSDDKELIAQISWSWGPASGRTAAYYLCNDRDWTLWERSSDFDSTILLFCQVAWGGSSIDIPARFAAEQLLLATWRKEKELHNTDFHEIEVTQEGLLTNHDIQRISLGVTGG